MIEEKAILDHLAQAYNLFIGINKHQKHQDDNRDFTNAIHDAQRVIATLRLRRIDPEFFGIEPTRQSSTHENFLPIEKEEAIFMKDYSILPNPGEGTFTLTDREGKALKDLEGKYPVGYSIKTRPDGDTPTDFKVPPSYKVTRDPKFITKGEKAAIEDGWNWAQSAADVPDGVDFISINKQIYWREKQ